MSDSLDPDLARRDNPSSWDELLRLALPILGHAADVSGPVDWSLGGGTAIALRIAHRVSDDIDIFVKGADLRALAPFKNPASAALRASVQFPGHSLKLQLPIGEIDFLTGAMLTAPGVTSESFEGRKVALQTCEEVIVRKVRYRAAASKARDVFDSRPSRAALLLCRTFWPARSPTVCRCCSPRSTATALIASRAPTSGPCMASRPLPTSLSRSPGRLSLA